VTALWRRREAVGGLSRALRGGAEAPAADTVTAVRGAAAAAWARLDTLGSPWIRHLSTSTETEAAGKKEEKREEREANAGDAQGTGPEAEILASLQGMTTEELHEHILEIKRDLEEKESHIAEMKDRLVRTLADMENLRERTSKQLEEARKFATQGLVKSLVDVADNLERAASSVVKDVDAAEMDVERALGLLHGLKDGVVMTDGILMKILEKEGVKRYDPSGESFDPNLHDALFEVPASEGGPKPGTVAVVVKKGYLMHDRAVRAAEVGVVKSED
jgi:molecular chaperone GrpE